MGRHTLFFASYEFGLTVVFGLVSAFVTLRVLRWLDRDAEDPFAAGNVAVAALHATAVICVALLVHAGVLPSVDAMRTMVLSRQELGLGMVGISFGYFLVFYVLALGVSLGIIWLGLKVYMASTPDLDEAAELKKGNLAVALVLCGVLLGVTLATRPPLERFMHALVDFESLDDLSAPPRPATEGIEVPEPPPMPR